MHWLGGVFLILHGLVHLLWFVVPWSLMEVDGLPDTTTVVGGRIDLGEVGARAAGLLWLLGTAAFVVAGLGLLFGAAWWWTAALVATAYSLFLVVLGWPVTRWSLLINLALLGLLLWGSSAGWSWLPFPGR